MIIKNIFLASSSELKEDREKFQLFIGLLNDDWYYRGIRFKLNMWEDFIESMAGMGLQERYNRVAEECDFFLMLFFTKVGEFTTQEFEAALNHFQSKMKPRIYTYFKESFISTGSIDNEIISMLDFKKRLSDLKHYVSVYTSIEDLQWKFSKQLEKIYGNKFSSDYVNSLKSKPQIDTLAIEGVCKLLSPQSDDTILDELNLDDLIIKASDFGKNAVFQLAKVNRRSNRTINRYLMARSIPVFEALVKSNIDRKDRHYYYGQLAYALKDQEKPDWEKADENFESAIQIRGYSEPEYFYEFNRAICKVRIKCNDDPHRPSDQLFQKLIMQDLQFVKKGIGSQMEKLFEERDNMILLDWLTVNNFKLQDL